jgi:hypothetical protein
MYADLPRFQAVGGVAGEGFWWEGVVSDEGREVRVECSEVREVVRDDRESGRYETERG